MIQLSTLGCYLIDQISKALATTYNPPLTESLNYLFCCYRTAVLFIFFFFFFNPGLGILLFYKTIHLQFKARTSGFPLATKNTG